MCDSGTGQQVVRLYVSEMMMTNMMIFLGA